MGREREVELREMGHCWIVAIFLGCAYFALRSLTSNGRPLKERHCDFEELGGFMRTKLESGVGYVDVFRPNKLILRFGPTFTKVELIIIDLQQYLLRNSKSGGHRKGTWRFEKNSGRDLVIPVVLWEDMMLCIGL